MSKISILDDCSQGFVIALDGPSAVGKSVLTQNLADHFKLYCCKTGLFFRKIAYEMIKNTISLDMVDEIISIARVITHEIEDINVLHKEIVGNIASNIASLPEVRSHFYNLYRQVIVERKRVILEGRDVTTVLAPDAHVKIYLTADVKVRAERRFKQLEKQGKHFLFDNILKDLISRDQSDLKRVESPLKISQEAIVVDSTNLSEQEVFNFLRKHIEAQL